MSGTPRSRPAFNPGPAAALEAKHRRLNGTDSPGKVQGRNANRPFTLIRLFAQGGEGSHETWMRFFSRNLSGATKRDQALRHRSRRLMRALLALLGDLSTLQAQTARRLLEQAIQWS